MKLSPNLISGKYLLVLLLSLCTYSTANASRENDSLALVQLHEALTFSWDLSQAMTTWSGIQLNAEGRVTHLTASPTGGILPDALGDLGELTYLDLSDADLAGRIPETITNLTKLVHLNLNENNLEGPIPANLGNLSNLEYLDISDNFLEEDIPTSIWQLTQLRYLSLGDRSTLSGTIPPEIANLINLEQLIITNTELTGGIPSEIGQLPNLKFLFLEDNQLTGSIPATFGNMPNLEEAILSSNHLTGEIPATITNMPKLQAFYVNDNQLSGRVPNCSEMPMLNTLAVNNNQLTFAGLEENLDIDNFFYSPQDDIPLTREGQPLVVAVGTESPSNTFDWYKDGTLQTTINGDSIYHPNSSGNYHCEIRNVPVTDPNSNGRDLVLTTQTLFYDIFEGLVFPGDLNRDGIADNCDALHWGLAFGSTGPQRPEASIIWEAQNAPDWTNNVSGINGKHQDGDGDGVVNSNDIGTIISNYGRTYVFEERTHQQFEGKIALEVADMTVNNTNVLVELNIKLEGKDATPAALHGIAFSIAPDEVEGDGIDHFTTTLDIADSWMGTANDNLQSITKDEPNTTDIALTRNDGQNATGIGSFCKLFLNYQINSAITLPDELTIAIERINLLNAAGEEFVLGDKKLTIIGLQNMQQGNGLAFAINTSDSACDQLATAEAEIVQQGTPPYQYNWSNGDTGPVATGLDADIYTLIITDTDGASAQGDISIEGDGPINIFPSITHTANNNDNGSISLSISGGNGDYTILWDDGQTETTVTSLGVGTHTVEVFDAKGCSQTADFFIGQEAVPATLQVFLQGAYNSTNGLMNDGMREKFLLPNIDPYLNTYQAAPGVFDIVGNNAIVDWILIELRDDISPKNIQHLRPVLLQRDGDIVDIDGVSPPQFEGLRHGLYHMVIRHRNHMPIMSTDPFLLTNTGLIYNFSAQNSFTGVAGFGQHLTENNTWVMYSGDATQNYEITGPDKSVWVPDNGRFLLYGAADYNLDGDINGSDKNFWFNNNGISSRVPPGEQE